MSVTIALAGNPNCGKTTIFNALTGSEQYVGNWPGVTVEKKEGRLVSDPEITIADLPGIYSLSPYTPEEVVARNYLVSSPPDVILDILDGTNIERNLYLTTQLMELGIPMVVLINMADVLEKRGDVIDLKKFSKAIGGCPVFEVSALKGDGLRRAVDAAVALAGKPSNTNPIGFSAPVEEAALEIQKIISPACPRREQRRFFAVKVFERDERLSELIGELPERGRIEEIIKKTEKKLEDDSESIITTERYAKITSIIKSSYINRAGGDALSEKIDSVLTNRWAAIPIFAAVMFVMYYVSVTSLGAMFSGIIEDNIFGDSGIVPVVIRAFLTAIGTHEKLISLIIDGIIAGVGSVLSFVPQIMILFIFMAFLEDCGYMSRVAFIMDGIFRKIGLSGKSFIPIIIGTGCGVPGIMASRTIENAAERRLTIITTTFIPCSAKLPMIALFSGVFLGGAWWAAPAAYLIGALAIIISGIILKRLKLFKGDSTPFIMELPPYHLPIPKNVFKSMWNRVSSFVKKAGTVILLSAIVIWLLSNLGISSGRVGFTDDFSVSILSYIGGAFAWLFKPLGFGTREAAVAVLSGLVAKENVVSTLAVLYPGADLASALTGAFTPVSAFAFLVFNLLCAPCVAAMAAIAREMSSKKWTAFALGYQTVFAYVVSFLIYQIGSLLI